MEHIPYFRIQAKNLLKDYKTRYFDESRKNYLYHSSHFDIGDLFRYFDFPDDREDFSLMHSILLQRWLVSISGMILFMLQKVNLNLRGFFLKGLKIHRMFNIGKKLRVLRG